MELLFPHPLPCGPEVSESISMEHYRFEMFKRVRKERSRGKRNTKGGAHKSAVLEKVEELEGS